MMMFIIRAVEPEFAIYRYLKSRKYNNSHWCETR